MTKIQCTGCGQVFWAELEMDEALIGPGEWIQNPCPKYGAKWATIERRPGRGRRAKPGPKRRGRARGTVQAKGERAPAKKEEGSPQLSAVGIRRLRKKLGLSQKKLASLIGVSMGTIVGWESGKYKPRAEKVAKLSELEKGGKPGSGNILEGQVTNQKKEESKAEQAISMKRPKAMVKKGSADGKRGRSSRRTA